MTGISYILGTNEAGKTVAVPADKIIDAMMAVPRVDPLIPNGIENFVPRCVVCTNPVPAKRATGRSKDTCGPECHKVLRAYRQHVLKSTKCPACYHPSTPAERKEFIAWRKMRGDRRQSVGRPKQNHEDKLRKTLARASGLLQILSAANQFEWSADFLHSVIDFEGERSIGELTAGIVNEAKELIDNVGNGAPTLTPERVNPDEGAKTNAI